MQRGAPACQTAAWNSCCAPQNRILPEREEVQRDAGPGWIFDPPSLLQVSRGGTSSALFAVLDPGMSNCGGGLRWDVKSEETNAGGRETEGGRKGVESTKGRIDTFINID